MGILDFLRRKRGPGGAGKQPRKVALINIHDYPRERYSVCWDYHVVKSGEGLKWGARLMSREPIGYLWMDRTTPTWPEGVPQPAYPEAPRMTQKEYLLLSAIEQARVRALNDAHRTKCSEIYEAHPKPVFVVDETMGLVLNEAEARAILPDDIEVTCGDLMRDACDYAAQQWVRERMPKYAIAVNPVSPQRGYALTLGPAGMLWDAVLDAARRLLAPLLTIAYSTGIRSSRLGVVITALDAGVGAALIRIYNGARPATCGTATTLLAEITCSDPSATEAAQVLTFDNTPALTDASANATGTATWVRCVDSTGACCIDGSVGTSGSDLNLNSTAINIGQAVTVTSATINAGNA